MVEYLARRSDENSQCFSRAKFKNASRPSINSHVTRESGSVVAGSGEDT